ncbi:hypothetical protein E7681_13585 [Thalassobius vesicularis]|uniref:Pilus assembly protein n=1 Tax=Thalassobius vesicularis TaxID=1294297 RepID=A0A4S3M939_9RHOB|nr:hypothetical protein [Thalassobius vesicularis]THD72948.1 hypothetical protein E7681_13585 [Thalassobius vesicularis]
MMKFINKFRKDENGAVTIDWVVLTATVVGISVAGAAAIETSTSGLTTETASALDSVDATSTINS